MASPTVAKTLARADNAAVRDVIDFLVQLILAITGAIGMALALAGGWALAGGCALWGGHWCWKRWNARTAKSRKDNAGD